MILRTIFVLLLIVVITPIALCQKKVNFIIQVNERLVVGELSGINLFLDSVYSKEVYDIDYIPGELIINEDAWRKINSDTSKKVFLKFDYNTFKGGRQTIATFFVELKK